MPKGTILIVDDSVSIRNVLVKKLSMAGYYVLTADNSEQAIKLLREEPPNLCFCDIDMGDDVHDGFKVLTEFPKQKRNFPIIMLTHTPDENSKLHAEKLGADGYLIKNDLTPKTLAEIVEKLRHM